MHHASTGRARALALAALAIPVWGAWTACAADPLPPIEPPPVTTPCHQSACDQVERTCVEVPVVDGTACDDHDACTAADHCVAGACVSSAVACDDQNDCTSDRCDTGAGCVHEDLASACDDHDACTSGDTCAAGACTGTPVACDDGDACTTERCDPEVGCVVAPIDGLGAVCGAIGRECPTGFACHGGATCESCDGSEVFVPGGRFWMGCNAAVDGACDADELPQHRVIVAPFAMQKTEVTAAEYRACVEAGGCDAPAETGGAYGTYDPPEMASHPITPVDWYEAADYCAWLDVPPGRDGTSGGAAAPWRLCSEAEWEEAARGSCATWCDRADDDACCRAAMPTYPWGDGAATCELAVMDDGGNGCGTGITSAVASRPGAPSPYGALDLAGNVWEWVGDCWHDDYSDAPADGSVWQSPDSACAAGRVIRGGSFGLPAADLRASNRTFFAPDEAYDYYGFRCCRSISEE